MPRRSLSPRQSQIAAYLIEGRTDKEIAAELGISESSVGNHLRVLFAKLRVHSRTAAAIAVYRGAAQRLAVEGSKRLDPPLGKESINILE